jgi:hypothetical protein
VTTTQNADRPALKRWAACACGELFAYKKTRHVRLATLKACPECGETKRRRVSFGPGRNPLPRAWKRRPTKPAATKVSQPLKPKAARRPLFRRVVLLPSIAARLFRAILSSKH